MVLLSFELQSATALEEEWSRGCLSTSGFTPLFGLMGVIFTTVEVTWTPGCLETTRITGFSFKSRNYGREKLQVNVTTPGRNLTIPPEGKNSPAPWKMERDFVG